jgi:UDP-N-acetylmuramate dehydrogenase
MSIEENVPLAPHTTFGIGGLARYLVLAQDEKEVYEGLVFAKEKQLPVLILGGGSNMLIDDAGFDGLVIKIEIQGIEIEAEQGVGGVIVVVGAGEGWDALVERTAQEGLWGMENLSGIPGTVGGAVAGNIGAYGQAQSQTLAWVEVWDMKAGEIKRFTNAECMFGYRESFFSIHSGSYIILRVAFTLTKTPKPELSYKDLTERFKDEKTPSLQAIREAVLTIRQGKFPDLDVEGTAGSFFKNPIVSKEVAEGLVARYPGLPIFAMPETEGVKVPLAWLLDRVLNLKGFSMGGARLFEKQPLVVAAKKGTPSSDVLELAQKVIEKVKENFSISIEPEVKIIK